MTRSAPIPHGNAGGGKSTLCRYLSRSQQLPLFSMDQLQWQPGWIPTSADIIAQQHAAILATDERYTGTGSTDFWGISFGFSSIDQQALSDEELERGLTLMRACWSLFDDVRSRVSAEMQRGPRGGGRNRDRIVQHTLAAEHDWARKLGVLRPFEELLTDEGLQTHREAYCMAIRSFHDQYKMARTWPLRYLIRHTAFHTLDHAWEMEDKDCSRGFRV